MHLQLILTVCYDDPIQSSITDTQHYLHSREVYPDAGCITWPTHTHTCTQIHSLGGILCHRFAFTFHFQCGPQLLAIASVANWHVCLRAFPAVGFRFSLLVSGFSALGSVWAHVFKRFCLHAC